MVMKIKVVFFWVMTLYNVVVGHECFRGPWCLQLQGEVNGPRKGSTDIGKYCVGQRDSDSRKKRRKVRWCTGLGRYRYKKPDTLSHCYSLHPEDGGSMVL
jgi:hypothetical protein